jgi:hypothetical protein
MASGVGVSEIGIVTRVYVRDEFGRFAKRVGEAVDEAMQEAAETGMRAAARMAPEIADTFYIAQEGEALWVYVSAHPWARGLNDGIPPHFIRANFENERFPEGVLASKERNFFARGPGVNHPGVKGKHFFERSYAHMKAQLPAILRRHKVRT